MLHADPNAKFKRFKFTVDKNADDSQYYLSHRGEPDFALPYVRRDKFDVLDPILLIAADGYATDVETADGCTIEVLVRDWEAEGSPDFGGHGSRNKIEQLSKRLAIGRAACIVTGRIKAEQWGEIGDTDKTAMRVIDRDGKMLLDQIPELDVYGRLPMSESDRKLRSDWWRRRLSEATKPDWSGDLHHNCLAFWVGLTLRAELMQQNDVNYWQWGVYENQPDRTINQVRFSKDDAAAGWISGDAARTAAEQAARQYLRYSSGVAVLSAAQCKQLQSWLSESGEFWVDLYVAHSGHGSEEYFVRTVGELEELISKQTGYDLQLCIFRRLQYAIRGIADDALLAQVLSTIPDGQWYHIFSLEYYYPSKCKSFGCDDNHAQLQDDFSKIIGKQVAIGQNPFDGDTRWVYSTPEEVLVLNLKNVLASTSSDKPSAQAGMV